MQQDLTPYYLALGANFAFASATVGFAHFSRRNSPGWVNAFKAGIAFLSFGILFLFLPHSSWPTLPSFVAFALSGLVGLTLGDLFLMRAFSNLGASRTLILFGFQPLILGFSSYFLFGQTIELYRLLAIFFLILCLFTFSLENRRKKGHWEFAGLLIGLLAVSLDAGGVLLSRWAFDQSPSVSAFEGNFYRTIGSVMGFGVWLLFRPLHLVRDFSHLSKREKTLILVASFMGTSVSLALYLTAVRTGHLATVSGIAITGPLFAGILESILEKKKPSWYLIGAFALFAIGFSILIF